MAAKVDYSRYQPYDRGEIDYVLKLMARFKNNTEIQDALRKYSPEKPRISTKLLEQIRFDNVERIARDGTAYANHIEGSPLNYKRLVADMFLELKDLALEERASGRFDADGNPIQEIDIGNAIKAAKAGCDALRDMNKLELEKLKLANNKMPIPTSNMEEEEEETSNVAGSWDIQ